MDNNTFEAALPFPGFYQSYIAQALDDEIDYVLDGVDAEKADALREKYYARMDYSRVIYFCCFFCVCIFLLR